MNLKALIGALGGGLIGALLWYAIAIATDSVSNFMAIGVGFLVGFGCKFASGRGVGDGMFAGLAAVLAIVGASYFAVMQYVSELGDLRTEDVSSYEITQAYSSFGSYAMDFYEDEPEGEDLHEYVEKMYVLQDDDGKIDEFELARFTRFYQPILNDMGPSGDGLSEDEFGKRYKAALREEWDDFVANSGQVSFASTIRAYDIMFWLLGAVFAFGVVTKDGDGN